MYNNQDANLSLQTANPTSRRTVGLIVPQTWTNSSFPVLMGVVDAARKYGTNLIVYHGYHFDRDPETSSSNGNIVYDLVNKDKIDGMIIWMTALGNHLSQEEMDEFCTRFQPLPLVSIGKALIPDVPEVLIDSYQGMCAVMEHLIIEHGYRRIAFIQGPEGHYEAVQRLEAYLDMLVAHGIPYDSALVSPPTYWNFSLAADAARELLGRQQVRPEVIVVSSDIMAFGVISALESMGIRIPEDIAVTGFNDDANGRAMNPPLTTAKLRMYERGWKTVEIMNDILAGNPAENRVVFPSVPVIRRSCGCPTMAERAIWPVEPPPEETVSLENPRDRLIKTIHAALEHPDREQAREWAEKLADAFIKQLQAPAQPIFISKFEPILHQTALSQQDLNGWHRVVTAMQEDAVRLFPPRDIERIGQLCYKARILVGEIGVREEVTRKITAERRNRAVSSMSRRLVDVFDLGKLTELLARELPRVGVSTCFLSLYVDPQAPAEWARLIMAYDEQGIKELPFDGVVFSSDLLVPEGMLPRDQSYGMVLEPLFFGENQIGFMLFEIETRDEFFYELLPTQIGTALWGAISFQREKEAERLLVQQAQELARSNAELEHFAYVASHDLQEPLRKITVFGERLKSLNHNFDTQSADYLNRMCNAAGRMQTLIEGLLAYSRVTMKGQPFKPVDVYQVAREVVSDLEIKITQTGGKVEIGDLPQIQADPIQIRQLFQNLIGNGLKYHRPDAAPLVKIYTDGSTQQTCRLIFEDNGIGIEKDYYERIFGVFERLVGRDEYDGVGVGLAICKKIVDRHHGRIFVESAVGVGTKFIVELPVKQ